MTSAFLWVIVPLFFALLLLLLNRYAKAAMVTGFVMSVLITFSALLLEVDRTYIVRGFPIKIDLKMLIGLLFFYCFCCVRSGC